MNPERHSRRLLLVRHGLPDYRDRKRADEPPGPPLSELGRRQIDQAAVVLARYEPVSVHTSPLARCRQGAARIGAQLHLPVFDDSDLKEWHRTEDLYRVNQRVARWLARWLAGKERCAVVVSHGSPLLGILRTALYLPHFGWWQPGDPDRVVLSTADRFELSMASVVELTIEPQHVTARCVFHPTPRIIQVRNGQFVRRFPRPGGSGENTFVRRPNFGPLIGYRT